jgi:hypothetical protein
VGPRAGLKFTEKIKVLPLPGVEFRSLYRAVVIVVLVIVVVVLAGEGRGTHSFVTADAEGSIVQIHGDR